MLIVRIKADYLCLDKISVNKKEIRVNPQHPCHPCSRKKFLDKESISIIC